MLMMMMIIIIIIIIIITTIIGKVVPVLTEHHAMKAYWGSGSIAPLIL
jgi:formate hydrogenlyase subunit 4